MTKVINSIKWYIVYFEMWLFVCASEYVCTN
jgi:hypothetical protein